MDCGCGREPTSNKHDLSCNSPLKHFVSVTSRVWLEVIIKGSIFQPESLSVEAMNRKSLVELSVTSQYFVALRNMTGAEQEE